ncbi:MAG: hypothetical protein N4A53_08635 [Pelagimonas sp.]|nr:hypothetical protein [Pelagimonas sp.]
MLIVLGLLIAFVLVVVFSNRDTRLCRWRERRGADHSDWSCVYCGATCQGPQGQPPQTCLRDKTDRA